MDICKSDITKLVSLLERASAVIEKYAHPTVAKPSDRDIARQLNQFRKKLIKKQQHEQDD